MFVALRRFTIPLTIVLQFYVLKSKTSTKAIFAIFILVLGSLIAVLQDFQFNLLGYFLCLVNDVGDSCEAIFTKKQLNIKNQKDFLKRKYKKLETSSDEDMKKDTYLNNSSVNNLPDSLIVEKYDKNQNLEEYYKKEIKREENLDYEDVNIGKVAIIYYCALLNLPPLCLVVYLTGDLKGALEFEYWNDTLFTLMFISCSFFSLVFLLTWITCTDFNSPLLSQIVSVMRSILSTYIGKIIKSVKNSHYHLK